jgi:hypothetical protein
MAPKSLRKSQVNKNKDQFCDDRYSDLPQMETPRSKTDLQQHHRIGIRHMYANTSYPDSIHVIYPGLNQKEIDIVRQLDIDE